MKVIQNIDNVKSYSDILPDLLKKDNIDEMKIKQDSLQKDFKVLKYVNTIKSDNTSNSGIKK